MACKVPLALSLLLASMISPCPAGRSGLSQEAVMEPGDQEGKVYASIDAHAIALKENSADFVVNNTMTRGTPIINVLPPTGKYNHFAPDGENNQVILFDMPQGIYYHTGNVVSTMSEKRTEELSQSQERFMVYTIKNSGGVHVRRFPSCDENSKTNHKMKNKEQFVVSKAADVDGRFFLGLADESGWIAESGCTAAKRGKAIAVTVSEAAIPVYYRFQVDGETLDLYYGEEAVARMSSKDQQEGSLYLTSLGDGSDGVQELYQEGIWVAMTPPQFMRV